MDLEKKIHKHFKNLIISSDCAENIEEHSLWIDTELMSPDLLEKNIKFIDRFPKRMNVDSPHNVLEIFFDLYSDKSNYLFEEYKFLKTTLLLLNYSNDIIISTNYIDYKKECENIEDVIAEEDIENLKIIKNNLFQFKDIKNDYFAINSLLKLAFREKIFINIFLLDLKISFDINSLAVMIYIENSTDFINTIEKICSIEGLYLRNN
ncbi:hypothetical protein QEW_0736 [Clostridioides difficile CD160]|nr:hypothetical protein QEW_0736 [Clostridioides difficile CD160]